MPDDRISAMPTTWMNTRVSSKKIIARMLTKTGVIIDIMVI